MHRSRSCVDEGTEHPGTARQVSFSIPEGSSGWQGVNAASASYSVTWAGSASTNSLTEPLSAHLSRRIPSCVLWWQQPHVHDCNVQHGCVQDLKHPGQTIIGWCDPSIVKRVASIFTRQEVPCRGRPQKLLGTDRFFTLRRRDVVVTEAAV